MLKFTYAETGIHLERLTQSLEATIVQRVLLAIRAEKTLLLQSGTASFLLPDTLPELNRLLEIAIQSEEQICLYRGDADFVEICLHGIWLTSDVNSDEGVFLSDLTEAAECLIAHSWQAFVSQQSSLIR